MSKQDKNFVDYIQYALNPSTNAIGEQVKVAFLAEIGNNDPARLEQYFIKEGFKGIDLAECKRILAVNILTPIKDMIDESDIGRQKLY